MRTAEWLEYGEGLPQAIDNAELVPQPSRYYRFPVVSSVVAGGWVMRSRPTNQAQKIASRRPTPR